jgi:hypothetical protein
MEALRKWLNGERTYQVGVKLYLIYSKDQSLKELFTQEHETTYKRDRLVQEIKKLLQPLREEDSVSCDKSASLVTHNIISEGVWPSDPVSDPVLKALKSQWRILFSEMMNLSHRLFDIVSDIERGQCAHRILDLDDLCDEIYLKRDYYLLNKVLPDQQDPEVITDPVKWPMKLKNAERYVRDYTLKCNADPDNEKYAAKLKYYTAVVISYKRLLKIEAYGDDK